MRCRSCGSETNLYKDYSVMTKTLGLRTYYKCRECNTKKKKRYRAGEKGSEASKRAVKRYEEKNPHRRMAWDEASKCIPLEPCSICGDNKLVHRHHPDIAKPLEIVFLCPLHHKRAHRVV